MRVKKIFIIMMIPFLFSAAGCTKIEPDSPSDGQYATQTPMSALEYSMYINKQITVFTNQLTTRMVMAKNLQESSYQNESKLAQNSIDVMQDALDEVVVTLPSDTREEDREALIMAMNTAIQHVRDYKRCIESNGDVSGYITNFQNDYNELTGLANLYYQ